ncbi:MAG: hypothetical protein H7Y07_00030 [Pyrinomonadaceae bacterium]|nr:hypothetical protein [Sphingobacteriaceae bacterium]
MVKLLSVSAFILSCFTATLTYAAGEKPCVVERAEAKKQPCNTSEKLIPEKLLKIKPFTEVKPSQRPVSLKAPASADTFESLITPFLKTVAPHFYDRIIRRDQKSATVQS